MPRSFYPCPRRNAPTYSKLTKPVQELLPGVPVMVSNSNKPIEVDFADQLNSLIYYHLENHDSGRHLIQSLQEDTFARNHIAPNKGMTRSTFFEMNNSRGLEQMTYMFNELQKQASGIVQSKYGYLGTLIAVDGSLLDAVLSMYWADYRKASKKAKVHVGFNINQGIPTKFHLTDGKTGERKFVDQIVTPGQTAVLDRGYHSHAHFDLWQEKKIHFLCRIKGNTKVTVVEQFEIPQDGIIFYDAVVLLGKEGVNQTKKPLRLVGYKILGTEYWVATDRLDISAEDVALIYKLRWDIEKFFKWWKCHLNVYHILFRSRYGLLIQILAGLITYLLLAIYCQEEYAERVSIKRVREIRTKIRNEMIESGCNHDVAHPT